MCQAARCRAAELPRPRAALQGIARSVPDPSPVPPARPPALPCPQAKKYVPPELPLVNFFGWTLGGFYLARYSDSPVGAFDEMVAMAGLAWNFPSSCAWAARVYVNNRCESVCVAGPAPGGRCRITCTQRA